MENLSVPAVQEILLKEFGPKVFYGGRIFLDGYRSSVVKVTAQQLKNTNYGNKIVLAIT